MEYQTQEYFVNEDLYQIIKHIQNVINHLNSRRNKGLSPTLREKINKHLKLSHVYNSNAIEGNILSLRETELILDNMEINDKPLKDQIEAKSLSLAIDFLHDLINGNEQLTKRSILELHQIVLSGVPNIEAGKFRSKDVQIKGAKHTPPSWLTIDEHIDKLFQWYESKNNISPIIKCVILHHWLVWIHPFEDGNGRVTRLVSNFFLLQNGFPEVVIRIEDRDRYYAGLEEADKGNFDPLIELFCDKLIHTVNIYEEFLNEEEREREWLAKYTRQNFEKRLETLRYNYEVWKSSLEIFKTRFEQSVNLLNGRVEGVSLFFREYEIISFNKFLDLQEDRPVSNTWYFVLTLINHSKQKNIKIIFYFERFYPSKVFTYKKFVDGRQIVKKYKKQIGTPIIKLYASTRQGGQTSPLDEKIDFANVGMFGDKMVVGIKSRKNRRFIETQETHMATPIIRDFLDQIIEIYGR